MSILTLAVATICPTLMPAQSDGGPSYNYLQFDVGQLRHNELDDNVDVLGIAASFELSDAVFLYADYGDSTANVGGMQSDVTALDIGLGAFVEIASNVDLFASAGFVSADSDLGGDENGHVIGAGLRAKASDQLELNAGMKKTSTGEEDSALWAGAVFSLNANLGLSARFTNGDDYDGIMIGLRLYL